MKPLKGPIIEFSCHIMAKNMEKSIRKLLPAAEYKKCEKKQVEIPMRDGININAFVASPDFTKKWPVVIMRYPYITWDWIKCIFQDIFTEHGYTLVSVQVRGTCQSQGEFRNPLQEDKDGNDVLEWVGKQEWCDGNIVTYGPSYLGASQWAIADTKNPMLKTMFISVFGAEGYNTFYHRGLFNLEVWGEWAAQMMGNHKYGMWLGSKLRDTAFSIRPQSELGEKMIGEPCLFYKDWVNNWSGKEEYWTKGYWKKLESMPEKISIPVFFVGGYYDIFLHAMLSSYKRIPKEIRDKSVFLIGPWAHFNESGGDITTPNADFAGFAHLALAVRWFDYIVKGIPYNREIGGIDAYEIGDGDWQFFKNEIHHDLEKIYYLDSGAGTKANGFMATLTPQKESKISYCYNPNNPVPSRGGRMIAGHNKKDGNAEFSCYQDEVGKREDVISFISEQFHESLKISGRIQAKIFISSDAPATAFTIKVSEVLENGKALNIRDDYTDIRWPDRNTIKEYQPGTVQELSFDMEDIIWRLHEESRLRIDISSSSNPLFAPHMNTLDPWAEVVEGKIATQIIYTGENYPSRVILPIAK